MSRVLLIGKLLQYILTEFSNLQFMKRALKKVE